MPISEDVILILNEREPLKQQMAELLVERARQNAWQLERLQASPELDEIVRIRGPRLLIVDYFIEGYGTGLDLLTRMQECSDLAQTKIIFWTDEPSIHVAVSALKMGALDYIEMLGEESLLKVCTQIESVLRTGKPLPKMLSKRQQQELCFQTKMGHACLERARGHARQETPLILLGGPSGVGRSALGQFLHSERLMAGAYQEIEVDTWDGTYDSIFESRNPDSDTIREHRRTVLLEHAEHDPEALLEQAESYLSRTQAQNSKGSGAMIVIATAEESLALAFHRRLKTPLIQIPSLRERPEDVIAITERILLERLSPSIRQKINLGEFLKPVAKEEWIGETRELIAVISECCIRICGMPQDSKRDLLEVFIEFLFEEKERYARLTLVEKVGQTTLDRQSIRQALLESAGNARLAAFMLGISVPRLRALAQKEQTLDLYHHGN